MSPHTQEEEAGEDVVVLEDLVVMVVATKAAEETITP